MSTPTPVAAELRFEELSVVARRAARCVHDVSLEIPPGEVTTLLGAERRRQVDARARGRAACSARAAAGCCSATRPDAPAARAGARRRRRGRPRGRRLLPALTVEDNLRVATYSLAQGGREGRDRLRARAVPRAREALEDAPAACSRAASSRWSCSRRRSSRSRRIMLVDELSLGLAPVVVKRLVPALEAVAATGVGVLLIEQFAHVALGLAKTAYVHRGRPDPLRGNRRRS